MLNKKTLFGSVLLLLILFCIIVIQQKKINSMSVQLVEKNSEIMEKEQTASTYKNEIFIKEKDFLKLKADFELEKNKLNENLADLQLDNTNLLSELKRVNSFMLEALLDGSERTPIVDSSISPDILSTIFKLYDAMNRNDIKDFHKIDVKGVLTGLYENRDNIEKILWIRHDPDNRAKAIQNEFGVESKVELLVVIFLDKVGSIFDPNFAMVKEHDKWIIFRED
ncbi:hypothetical protein AB4Z50_34765 [Paenibacillus sp. 2TAB26]|uniref:hypothetical protein n=1 Tax=Paenibacillus sp. 2TAB26 TaxID=3233005 RepID=UPI003F9BECB1